MKVEKYIDILEDWKKRIGNKESIESEVDRKKFTNDMNLVEDKLTRLQVCINMLERMARHMTRTGYIDHVYEIVLRESDGLDSIYGDFIERLVGTRGLEALIENKLVETCGVVNGRQLYVLK